MRNLPVCVYYSIYLWTHHRKDVRHTYERVFCVCVFLCVLHRSVCRLYAEVLVMSMKSWRGKKANGERPIANAGCYSVVYSIIFVSKCERGRH